MKKLLMILGGVFLTLVLVAIIGFGFLARKGNALDKESKQYVDTAVPAIISNWDIKEATDRASPELRKAVTDEELKKLFDWFRKLGAFKEYKGSQGEAGIFVNPGQGEVITAKYVAQAEYESGPAEINISLIKHGETWQILSFQLNSKALLEEK